VEGLCGIFGVEGEWVGEELLGVVFLGGWGPSLLAAPYGHSFLPRLRTFERK